MRFVELFEATRESETAKLFDQTATAQRGLPERIMGELQMLLGGGVYSFVIEHVGDLTHRMTESFDYMRGGHEYVEDKVEKSLAVLEHRYGFEREMKENLKANYTYRKERGEMPYETYEDFVEAVRKLSKAYADAHRKVPVFNEPQKRARSAAVSLGEWDFLMAKVQLRWLARLVADKDAYREAVSQVDRPPGMTENTKRALQAAKELLQQSRPGVCGTSMVVDGHWIESHTIGCRDAADVPEEQWWEEHWRIYDEYASDGRTEIVGDPADGVFVTITPQRVKEGHDNAFYLHPDIEPRMEYPLPADAKKYKNIKSKRRGGAKVKVKVDPNSMENVI